MVEYQRPQPAWRRWLLGGKDSWRRIVLAGIGGGVALAVVGALAVSFIGDGGGGALDSREPTAIAPGIGPGGPPIVPPVDDFPTLPPEEVPTEALPTEPVPTEPVEVPTEEPTFEPVPTEPIEIPTEPVVEGGEEAP